MNDSGKQPIRKSTINKKQEKTKEKTTKGQQHNTLKAMEIIEYTTAKDNKSKFYI